MRPAGFHLQAVKILLISRKRRCNEHKAVSLCSSAQRCARIMLSPKATCLFLHSDLESERQSSTRRKVIYLYAPWYSSSHFFETSNRRTSSDAVSTPQASTSDRDVFPSALTETVYISTLPPTLPSSNGCISPSCLFPISLTTSNTRKNVIIDFIKTTNITRLVFAAAPIIITLQI